MTILGLEGTKIYKIQNNLNLESLKTLVINDDIFGNIDTVTDTDTNKLIIEKYIELYIKHTTNKTNYFDEAYFTELKTNVNLINNRLLIDTENINEIDMTFFANKKIIEYIFDGDDKYLKKIMDSHHWNINPKNGKEYNFSHREEAIKKNYLSSKADINKVINWVEGICKEEPYLMPLLEHTRQ